MRRDERGHARRRRARLEGTCEALLLAVRQDLVNHDRIREYCDDLQFVSTARADERIDLVDAPGRLFSVGVSDPAARPYEVDVLVNAGALRLRARVGDPPDPPPLSLSKNVERAAMRVNMRLKRHAPARRTIADTVYEGLLIEHKPASAEQFLKLVHNVTVWGDPTFLVAASWDARPDQLEDERDLGPSWMGLLQPKSD